MKHLMSAKDLKRNIQSVTGTAKGPEGEWCQRSSLFSLIEDNVSYQEPFRI